MASAIKTATIVITTITSISVKPEIRWGSHPF
jgi:hypothetical protein